MTDERELKINIILVDEETNRNEVLTFQSCMKDNISVKGLISKIHQSLYDPILRKKSYDCIALANNFVLDDSELLQSYFLPSRVNQFAIAIPFGETTAQSVKLALPVIRKEISKGTSERKSVNLSSKEKRCDILPSLLQAVQCDSMYSIDTADEMDKSSEIRIPHFVYVILALIFMHFIYRSSEKNMCS